MSGARRAGRALALTALCAALALTCARCGPTTTEGTTRPFQKTWPSGVVRTDGREVFRGGKWLKEGEFVYFDEDGDETHRGAYRDGLESGAWTEKGEDGATGRGEYLAGRRHGLWRYVHPNGQLAEEGAYERGDRTGVWRRWYTNGRLSEEGAYERGERVGVWKQWSAAGEPRPDQNYGGRG